MFISTIFSYFVTSTLIYVCNAYFIFRYSVWSGNSCLIYSMIPTPSKVLGTLVEPGFGTIVFRRSSETGSRIRASQTSFSLFLVRRDAPTIRHCMLLWSTGLRVLTHSSYPSESSLWIPCLSRLSWAFLVLGTLYPSMLVSILWRRQSCLHPDTSRDGPGDEGDVFLEV